MVFYVKYYTGGLTAVFLGSPLEIWDKYSFALPDIDSEGEWLEMKNNFFNHATLFIEEANKPDDKKLNEPIADVKFITCQDNIEGITGQSYYLPGQIVLVRKMLKITGKNRQRNKVISLLSYQL